MLFCIIKHTLSIHFAEKRFGQPQNPNKEQDAETLQESSHEKIQQSKKQKKGSAPVKGQKQAPNPLNEGKRARLIIRNLSFKVCMGIIPC